MILSQDEPGNHWRGPLDIERYVCRWTDWLCLRVRVWDEVSGYTDIKKSRFRGGIGTSGRIRESGVLMNLFKDSCQYRQYWVRPPCLPAGHWIKSTVAFARVTVPQTSWTGINELSWRILRSSPLREVLRGISNIIHSTMNLLLRPPPAMWTENSARIYDEVKRRGMPLIGSPLNLIITGRSEWAVRNTNSLHRSFTDSGFTNPALSACQVANPMRVTGINLNWSAK